MIKISEFIGLAGLIVLMGRIRVINDTFLEQTQAIQKWHPTRRQISFFLLITLALFLRFWQLNAEYGFSDEGYHAGLGQVYFDNFLHFKSSFWMLGHEHPPVAKYLYGFALSLYPQGHYVAARMVSTLLGTFSCILVVLIAEYFIDFQIGLLAGFLLCLLPHYVGHNQISGLETPSIFFGLSAIWSFLKYRKEGKRKWFVLSFICFGLLIGVRFNNALLGIPILYGFLFMMNDKEPGSKTFSNKYRLDKLGIATIYFLLSVCVLYISWPWIWFHPVRSLDQSHFVNELVKDIGPTGFIYFFGKISTAPYSYYFIYFLVTTPGLLLIPFFMGLGKKKLPTQTYIFLLLLFLSPFLLSFTPFRREGIRYVLSIYPGLAIFSALGIYSMYESLKKYWNHRYLYQILSAAFLFYLLFIYMRVHPYELNYYNEWIGGPSTVYKNRWFQISRWGSGITEGIRLLDSLPEANPTVDIRVLPFIETPLPQRQDIIIQKAPYAEYFMMNANYKWYYSSKDEIKGYSLYTSVNVMGAPLVKIYKRTSNENQLPVPLNSANWKAISNYESNLTENALNRDLGSLWNSHHAQDPGMYFQVDMLTTARIQRIGLVTWTTPSAYPKGYEVTVSLDGQNWTKVAENPNTPPTEMVLEIPFTPVYARFIKVTQTGYSDLSGWAIHEFYVYPAS